MKKNSKLISVIIVLFMVLCLHTSSAFAQNDSPEKVVKNFAKAYFMLDNSMAQYLAKDAVNKIDPYLEKKATEARNRGYKISFLQKFPTRMNIKIINMNDSSATVEFDAITIRNINPVFRIIGSALDLLEQYKVHDIITLVKENQEWKISPGAFEMAL